MFSDQVTQNTNKTHNTYRLQTFVCGAALLA